jgi:hypothetical protein
MSDWYAPNQQAVREDQSGPAEEGEGGSPSAEPTKAKSKKPEAKKDEAEDK